MPVHRRRLEVSAVDTYTILTFIALGTVPGFYVGRWYAETFRARFDMRRTWDNRDQYRR